MCLPFAVLFLKIWFSDRGGGVHQRRRSPNYINWVYFGQIIENGILMGGKMGKKLV